MRKMLLLAALLLSVVSYGQVATTAQWGVARSTDSLNETRAGFLLGPGAGRYLKSLVDNNTANFANYAPKAGVTNDFSVGGNLTIPAVNGRYLGFTSFASGMTLSFKFGDDANSLANTWGGPMRLGGYHGIVIQNNASGALPALRVNGVSSGQDIAQFYKADGSLAFAITQAGGWKFPDGTIQTTASSGSGGGGGNSSAQLGNGVVVSVRTHQAVQDAIDAVPANNQTPYFIYLAGGDYLASGKTDEIVLNKNKVFLRSFDKSRLVGDANRSLLLKVYNAYDVGLNGIGFYAPSTTGYYPPLLVNQQGSVDSLLVENCDFTTLGDINTVGIIPFADNDNASVDVYHKHITIRRNRFFPGRMPVEVVNHGWNDKIRVQFFTFQDNEVYNAGNADPNKYGMMSLSGQNWDVLITGNWFINSGYTAIENIGTRRAKITNNHILSSLNDGATGISLTDGGNTEKGNANKGADDILITGNQVYVSGHPIHGYYASNIQVGLNNFVSTGSDMLFQHCDYVSIANAVFKTSFYAGISFDASNYCTVVNSRITMPTTGAAYQKIGWSNGGAFGKATGNELFGKSSDNGSEILLNGNNNLSKDNRLNGLKLTDSY